jgi:hypothetical protein
LTLKRHARVVAFAAFAASSGCSIFAGVDWDRVVVGADAGPNSNGTYPDGIPPGSPGSEDGGIARGACPDDQVECLAHDGIACCPRPGDVGVAVSIAAGGSNTCAVTSTGQVRCWGQNGNGQLGRGLDTSVQTSNRPLSVFRIPSGAKQVTLGQAHVCAIVDSLFTCWGANTFGQYGNGSLESSYVPVVVPLADVPEAIGAGTQTTCASMGKAGFCWGDNGAFQGGNESDQRIVTPSAVTALPTLAPGPSTIAASHQHSCAAGASGLLCWGNNSAHRLGSSGPSMIGSAVAVTNGDVVASQVTLGEMHGCAIAGGSLRCWGSNIFGELGDDAVQLQSDGAITPTAMASGVESVCAGYGHTCAVQSGKVKCTGDNSKGQTGTGSSSRVFTQVPNPGDLTATQVACGMFHTCALFDDGSVQCWGYNDAGQLGAGISDGQSSTPRDVMW